MIEFIECDPRRSVRVMPIPARALGAQLLQRVLLSPSLDSREITDLEHGEGTEPSPMAAGAEKTIGKAVPKVSCSLNSSPTRTVASLFPFTAHFHPLRSPSPCGTFCRKSATARYSRCLKASDQPFPLPVGSQVRIAPFPPNIPALTLTPVSAFHHSHSLT